MKTRTDRNTSQGGKTIKRAAGIAIKETAGEKMVESTHGDRSSSSIQSTTTAAMTENTADTLKLTVPPFSSLSPPTTRKTASGSRLYEEGESESDDGLGRGMQFTLREYYVKIKKLEGIVNSRDEYIEKLRGEQMKLMKENEELRTRLEETKTEGDIAGASKKKNVRKKQHWTPEEQRLRNAVSHQVRWEICPKIKFLPPGWDKWSKTPKTLCQTMIRRLGLKKNKDAREKRHRIIAPFVQYKLGDHKRYVNSCMKTEWKSGKNDVNLWTPNVIKQLPSMSVEDIVDNDILLDQMAHFIVKYSYHVTDKGRCKK